MKAIKTILALWFGLLSFATLNEAGAQECTSERSAREAYDRLAEAHNSGNIAQATFYNLEFWKTYENNRDCAAIKVMADKLNSVGITKTSVGRKSPSIDNSCTPPCTVIIEDKRSADNVSHPAQER